MSTCIREGVYYKRHRWGKEDANTCSGCGRARFENVIDASDGDSSEQTGEAGSEEASGGSSEGPERVSEGEVA